MSTRGKSTATQERLAAGGGERGRGSVTVMGITDVMVLFCVMKIPRSGCDSTHNPVHRYLKGKTLWHVNMPFYLNKIIKRANKLRIVIIVPQPRISKQS